MLIIDSLIKEHIIIKKMLLFLNKWVNSSDFSQKKQIVQFFKKYADKIHHGKEEKILFKKASKKMLSKEDRLTLDELLNEHKMARKLVKKLSFSRKMEKALIILDEIMVLYSMHIDKENNHFFLPCLSYFSKEEKNEILEKFEKFDKKHKKEKEKFEKIVDLLIKDHLKDL